MENTDKKELPKNLEAEASVLGSMISDTEQAIKLMEILSLNQQMKKWNRRWKIELIEEINPEWKDLYNGIL